MKVGKNLRGWVRGFSMWPNLIPGDILRTVPWPADLLRPGMIAVFPEEGQDGDTVHRVISVRNCSCFSVVATAGDRSGMDEMKRRIEGGMCVGRVTGVLRLGRYRPVSRLKVPEMISPIPVVSIVCGIVRRFFW